MYLFPCFLFFFSLFVSRFGGGGFLVAYRPVIIAESVAFAASLFSSSFFFLSISTSSSPFRSRISLSLSFSLLLSLIMFHNTSYPLDLLPNSPESGLYVLSWARARTRFPSPIISITPFMQRERERAPLHLFTSYLS